MTWIKTIPFAKADEKLRGAIERQRALYPPEYAQPTALNPDDSAGVVAVRVSSRKEQGQSPSIGSEECDAGLESLRREQSIAA